MATSSSSQVSLSHLEISKLSLAKQQTFKNQIREFRKRQKEQRKHVTLFRAPFTTLVLCATELRKQISKVSGQFKERYILASSVLLFSIIIVILRKLDGPHRIHFDYFFRESFVAMEWVILGILSSVGLGTGLHTFVLYLGPFIAKVALAASECGSIDFPLHGKGAFLCPIDIERAPVQEVSFWSVVTKVQFAALCWGVGTAIGELPPYFVARGARLSGKRMESVEDSDYDSDEYSLEQKPSDSNSSIIDRIKQTLHTILSRYTFIAILLMASIPNPLFDVAGLTCGYSLIPFWTFFGATLIGKALIKANLQTFLVVLMFRRRQLDYLIAFIEKNLPIFHGQVKTFFERETARFHPHSASFVQIEGKTTLARVWDVVLFLMIIWFVISIINSTAQGLLIDKDRQELDRFKRKSLSRLLSDDDTDENYEKTA